MWTSSQSLHVSQDARTGVHTVKTVLAKHAGVTILCVTAPEYMLTFAKSHGIEVRPTSLHLWIRCTSKTRIYISHSIHTRAPYEGSVQVGDRIMCRWYWRLWQSSSKTGCEIQARDIVIARFPTAVRCLDQAEIPMEITSRTHQELIDQLIETQAQAYLHRLMEMLPFDFLPRDLRTIIYAYVSWL